ncbi:MAG: hypothetical protein DMG35_04965 [Acidobacteria bacterium]|nr:MAG: hypothetical protein DMG35_04965 [Acidobacteriota bacterium]
MPSIVIPSEARDLLFIKSLLKNFTSMSFRGAKRRGICFSLEDFRKIDPAFYFARKEAVMPVESCIPVIPSANLEKSLRLWVDGLGFSMSSEMYKDGKLIFCMLRKDGLCFMLNQRAGTPVKPEDYEGIRLYWRRRTYTKPGSDCRAWGTLFQNSNIENTGRPSFSLPTTTAIRIASASLHKNRHLQAKPPALDATASSPAAD